MKITLYVNINTCEVYNQEEFNKIIKGKAEKLKKDEDEFSNYLKHNYTTLQLFQLTEEEHSKAITDFEKNWCLKASKEILLDEKYVEREIEIYFDPDTLSVLDEVHFQQMIIDNTEKAYKDHKTFRNWLLQNFYAEEILDMDESDKEQAYLEYRKYCC